MPFSLSHFFRSFHCSLVLRDKLYKNFNQHLLNLLQLFYIILVYFYHICESSSQLDVLCICPEAGVQPGQRQRVERRF